MKIFRHNERMREIDPAVAILLSAYGLTQVSRRTISCTDSAQRELDRVIENHLWVVQESLRKMVGNDFFLNEVHPRLLQLLRESEYSGDAAEQE